MRVNSVENNTRNVAFEGLPMAIGNMKMNMLPKEATALVAQIAKDTFEIGIHTKVKVGMAPTSLSFESVANKISEMLSPLKLGAQEADLGITKNGAVTGAISQDMYKALGADFTLIGHSERRTLFGETDAMVNSKVLSSLTKGLKPIVCVGESLAEREAGQADMIVSKQVVKALKDVPAEAADKVAIAYEPLWAINTGKTCDSEEAQRMCKMIRDEIAKLYNGKTAKDTSILYGGSVKAQNAEEIFAKPDIDGGLVGGACLKAEDFTSIVNSLAKAKV